MDARGPGMGSWMRVWDLVLIVVACSPSECLAFSLTPICQASRAQGARFVVMDICTKSEKRLKGCELEVRASCRRRVSGAGFLGGLCSCGLVFGSNVEVVQ